MAGVAMPAAAKLMADNHLAAGSVAGTGKDGRVTKGDVLVAVATPSAPKPVAVSAMPASAISAAAPQRCRRGPTDGAPGGERTATQLRPDQRSARSATRH
jgi:2-oxoglutarate dehydrogenase E2 component (dihydrolipoamide succinyltransferase)